MASPTSAAPSKADLCRYAAGPSSFPFLCIVSFFLLLPPLPAGRRLHTSSIAHFPHIRYQSTPHPFIPHTRVPQCLYHRPHYFLEIMGSPMLRVTCICLHAGQQREWREQGVTRMLDIKAKPWEGWAEHCYTAKHQQESLTSCLLYRQLQGCLVLWNRQYMGKCISHFHR